MTSVIAAARRSFHLYLRSARRLYERCQPVPDGRVAEALSAAVVGPKPCRPSIRGHFKCHSTGLRGRRRRDDNEAAAHAQNGDVNGS